MKLVNLTPHKLNIFDLDGKEELVELPPSGTIARFSDNERFYKFNQFEGNIIPVFKADKPGVIGMPPEESDTLFIVSIQIRVFLKERKDVASPGEIIRNQDGQPIGCKGLIVN